MYSSSSHSQFYPVATERWIVRSRRWATGLTTAALLLLMPHHGRAHDEGPPQPLAPVTLQITGLQHAYPIGQPISGQVVVTTSEQLLASSLEIVVVDPDTCVSPTNCPELFRKSYKIKLKEAGSETISFGLPAGVVSAYTLTATLTGKTKSDNVGQKRTLATATTRFGIRQAELTGVLDYILKAQVVSLNVPGILAQLTAGATTGTPVTLSFGTHQITVRVVQQDLLLAPGVELPNGLGRPLAFDGQLVDAQGNNLEGSLVTFTGPNNQLGAMVQTPLAGLQGINTLWIAPLNNEQVVAAADRHLIYLQSDTIPPPAVGPTGHGLLEIPPPAAAALLQAAPQAALSAEAVTTAAFAVNYPMHAQVYEHTESVFRTRDLWNVMVNWASEFRAKFSGVGIIPRTATDFAGVVVPYVTISSWRAISTTGYGDVCRDNLNKFRDDTQAGLNGIPFFKHLQVLFTPFGTDCGGIAKKGGIGGSLTEGDRIYSLTKYVGLDVAYLTMVNMQETGHNLDWHDDGSVQNGRHSPPPWRCEARNAAGCTLWSPHDDHTGPEISEFELIGLGPLLRCTAMSGSYGGCTDPQPTYSWRSGEPLRHLAEGISVIFQSSE